MTLAPALVCHKFVSIIIIHSSFTAYFTKITLRRRVAQLAGRYNVAYGARNGPPKYKHFYTVRQKTGTFFIGA